MSPRTRAFGARARRLAASVGTGALVLVGALTGVTLMAGVASAHTPSVTADCHGLTVSLADYNATDGGVNTVTVVVDGTTLVDHAQFATSYSDSVPWTTYAAHTYSVAVVAHDDPTGVNGWTKTFTGTSTPCTTQAQSTAPGFTEPTCQSPLGHVTIPAVTGAQYAINGSDVAAGDHTYPAGSSVTVTVRAVSAQYTLTGDLGPWTHTFGSVPDCTTHATPVAPTVTQASCTGPGQQGLGIITLSPVTGVLYSVDGGAQVASGTFSVAVGHHAVDAFPASGYTLDGTTHFDVDITAAPCLLKVTPIAPTLSQGTCTGTAGGVTSATITIPSVTGVDYEIDGVPAKAGTYDEQPGGYTVTATPEAGYTFGGDETTAVWNLRIDTPSGCDTIVKTVTPSISQFVCTKSATRTSLTGPTYTIPRTTGVDYLVGGDVVPPGTYEASPGVVHIVARAQHGYAFAAGTTTHWNLTIDKAPTCVLGEKFHRPPPHVPPTVSPKVPPQVLPFTGMSLPIAPAVLVALLAIGAGAALTVSVRRPKWFVEFD